MIDTNPFAGVFKKYRVSAGRHIATALKYVDQHRVAVQAGGHVGCWPVCLAEHFETVYTWEPAPADFVDLIHNLEEAGVSDRVFAARGMLGEHGGTGLLSINGSGSSKRRKNMDGEYPIYRLDDLELVACDLIYLDVEGDELSILRGGADLLQRCRPVVAAEERPKFVTPGALDDFLSQFGYKHVDTHSSDLIWQAQ